MIWSIHGDLFWYQHHGRDGSGLVSKRFLSSGWCVSQKISWKVSCRKPRMWKLKHGTTIVFLQWFPVIDPIDPRSMLLEDESSWFFVASMSKKRKGKNYLWKRKPVDHRNLSKKGFSSIRIDSDISPVDHFAGESQKSQMANHRWQHIN